MIKNFLFRPTSANMLHHPFVQNIKNEGHVVESLKKHLTGIIKKRQKKLSKNLLLQNKMKKIDKSPVSLFMRKGERL